MKLTDLASMPLESRKMRHCKSSALEATEFGYGTLSGDRLIQEWTKWKADFAEWLEGITPERLIFVDRAFAVAEKNYTNGGDVIVECFGYVELEKSFETIADVQEFCGLKLEQALNARWGSDDDPQLADMRRFEASGDWSASS